MSARKKQKQKMSKEDKRILAEIERRYLKLRMTMSHEEAIELLKKEAEEVNAKLNGTNRTDDPVVCETGSNVIEERKD